MWLGILVCIAGLTTSRVGALVANFRRLQLIRNAPSVEAVLGRPRRVFLLHEMFRGADCRTFTQPYAFDGADGRTHSGRAWICGCARHLFREGEREPVVYDPSRPRRNLLLRLAVVRKPR